MCYRRPNASTQASVDELFGSLKVDYEKAGLAYEQEFERKSLNNLIEFTAGMQRKFNSLQTSHQNLEESHNNLTDSHLSMGDALNEMRRKMDMPEWKSPIKKSD